MVFQVFTDTEKLFGPDVTSADSAARGVDMDIAGQESLRLVLTGGERVGHNRTD